MEGKIAHKRLAAALGRLPLETAALAWQVMAHGVAYGVACIRHELNLEDDAAAAVVEYLQKLAASPHADRPDDPDTARLRWGADAPDASGLRAELAAAVVKAARAVWPERDRADEEGFAAPVLARLSPETRKAVCASWAASVDPQGAELAWMGGALVTPSDAREVAGATVLSTRRAREAGPPPYLRALTHELWSGFRAELQRLYALAPALLIPVHRDIGHALRAVGQPPEEGEQLRLPGLVAVMPEGAETLARALRAAEEVSPMLAQRVMRALVAWGAAAWAGEGQPVRLAGGIAGQRTAGGAVELVIEGGLEALRVAVGSTKKGDRVADVLSIFRSHGTRWRRPGGQGDAPLLFWREAQRETAGRRAVAVITLGPLLLPGLAAEAGVPVADRVLVPALPVPPMPSKCWPGWAGPLAALDWFALERLALERAELAAEGGVALRWTVLAREAGASDRALAVALELWQTCGRYREVSAGRWALGDGAEEQRAHALLMDGAGRSQRAREAGRRSVARRTGPRE